MPCPEPTPRLCAFLPAVRCGCNIFHGDRAPCVALDADTDILVDAAANICQRKHALGRNLIELHELCLEEGARTVALPILENLNCERDPGYDRQRVEVNKALQAYAAGIRCRCVGCLQPGLAIR